MAMNWRLPKTGFTNLLPSLSLFHLHVKQETREQGGYLWQTLGVWMLPAPEKALEFFLIDGDNEIASH